MDIQPIKVPDALAELGAFYTDAGHELWLVGGSVRDHILNVDSKDVDLATSATPDEQIALLDAAGYRWFGTGLQHGTITVLAGNEAYEITTFRTDVETDGRHAVVAFTRDLETDLARRDLTMNAIAMSFDGRIVDPFGGVQDTLAGRVRFVGNAGERIREDYLRIMRWFRFAARFNSDYDEEAMEAIRANAEGLKRISVERIWSEMARILIRSRPSVFDAMWETGVLKVLGLPRGNMDALFDLRPHTTEPALLMGAWMGTDALDVMRRWKTSTIEREATKYASAGMQGEYTLAEAKLDLVDGLDRTWLDAVLRGRGDRDTIRALEYWEVPAMPVQGRDLVQAGIEPGPAVGQRLRDMRKAWIASDYALTREDLMGVAA